jgi:hypothetical protein
MKYNFLIFFALNFFFLNSCNNSKKNIELTAREQKLSEREKEFSLKESDYQNLLKMRDSLFAKRDTTNIAVIPENILGKWNGKMICTESNCPENMIGDVRTDTWEFSSSGSNVSAKVTNKAGNVRIYTGNYNGSELRLSYRSDSSSIKKTKINIPLNGIQNNQIKGIRQVIGENNCVSRFSLDLEKSKN